MCTFNLFNRQPNSSTIAKSRLRQVLVHDRVNLSSTKKENLRDEAMPRYVEVESEIALTGINRQNCLNVTAPVRVYQP